MSANAPIEALPCLTELFTVEQPLHANEPAVETPTIEIAISGGDWPAEPALEALASRAVAAALGALPPDAPRPTGALSLLFTDDEEIRALNAKWRGIDKPTNVLSFRQPAQIAPNPASLGDIALAAETIRREAALAQKPLEDHIAHLIIHGFFHLLGYDHQVEAEAEAMEQLERTALNRMGIADPYADADRQ